MRCVMSYLLVSEEQLTAVVNLLMNTDEAKEGVIYMSSAKQKKRMNM